MKEMLIYFVEELPVISVIFLLVAIYFIFNIIRCMVGIIVYGVKGGYIEEQVVRTIQIDKMDLYGDTYYTKDRGKWIKRELVLESTEFIEDESKAMTIEVIAQLKKYYLENIFVKVLFINPGDYDTNWEFDTRTKYRVYLPVGTISQKSDFII